MILTRLEAPEVEPISLAEVKQALAVVGTVDDALLTRLISSSVQSLDGPEGRLGRCLCEQRWVMRRDCFPANPLRIPLAPTIGVVAVTYIDLTGTEQEYEDYEIAGLGSSDGATIIPNNRWPSSQGVLVEFSAGFGDGDAVPSDLRDALIAIVGARYSWRESQIMSQGSLANNQEVQDILDRWTIKGFGA